MSESKHTPEAAPAASPWPHRVRLGSHFFENSYEDGSYYCLELRERTCATWG